MMSYTTYMRHKILAKNIDAHSFFKVTMTPPSPLEPTDIQLAIDEACDHVSHRKIPGEFRRATEKDFGDWKDCEDNAIVKKERDTTTLLESSLLFGVVAAKSGKRFLTTFYLAYSTWDGRVLYLDRLAVPHPSLAPKNKEAEDQHDAELITLARIALGDIALRLKCSRFTWQHKEYPQNLAGNVQPEYLKGWLTLHLDRAGMNAFAGDAPPVNPASSLSDKIDGCLALQKNGRFNLRLAKPTDVDVIGRLVNGLAVYEKEPDAVNMTVDDYRVDGFDARQPLFYCFLLEDASVQGQPYVYGMAFCFLGCTLSEGPFIYLEDLFIEEEYRGKGGGSMVMRSLALLGQSLDCAKIVWQALDWNTPALTFYSKIGATVQDGLLTSRYAGPDLVKFVGN